MFQAAIKRQFAEMSKHDLFRAAIDKDDMWSHYLSSFPAGTDPIYKKRTEHDCSCCRHFVKTMGNVVAVIDGKLASIWDCVVADPAYQAVADSMAELVTSKPICDVFLHHERGIGNKHYFFMLDGCKNDGQARGFYNEFLKGELDRHRKVIEIVGSRAKTAHSDAQLSGLGFSSTLRKEVVVRVEGAFTRTLKILI